MSRQNVRKKLSDKLLNAISAEEVRKMRRSAQRSGRPQVLFLENLNFIKEAIREINTRHGDKLEGSLKFSNDARYLKIARNLAEKRQSLWVARNYFHTKGGKDVENTLVGRQIKTADPKTWKKIKAGKCFIVASFGSLRSLKGKIIDAVVTGKEEDLKRLKAAVDRGHGGGKGSAVSNLTLQGGLKQLDSAVNDPEVMAQITSDFAGYIDNAIKTGDIDPQIGTEIKTVVVNYDSNVTKTVGLSAKYVPYIVYQNKYENRGTEAARDKEILRITRKFFDEIGSQTLTDLEGSSSVRDKVIARTIAPVLNITYKNKKIKIDKKIDPRKINFKTKGEAKSSKAGAKATKGVRKHNKKTSVKAPRKTRATQSTASLANILAVLNARLPDTVANNMGAPRLENRTGRFAGSVRAVDMIQTKQGFPSIGYTYQKNPYEVFESTSGTRFSDIERDPRPLIDRSIREIMATYFLGRIYTRRE